MFRAKFFAALSALLLSCAAGPVAADTLKAESFVFGNGAPVTVPATSAFPASAQGQTFSAGAFRILFNGDAFDAFCTELNQNISFGQTYTDFTKVADASLNGLASFVTDNAASDAIGSGLLQLAVWKHVYGEQLTTHTGPDTATAYRLQSPTAQDLVIFVPNEPGTVPEPAGLALLGLGLVGLSRKRLF